MDINYNIISLFDILGLVQGLILGSLLLLINRKKDKSTLFLGIFIIVYALELLPAILWDLNVLSYYPEYLLLPIRFTWLIYALFYVYVQKVSIFAQLKINYNVLIPGLAMFFVEIIIFSQSVETKLEIVESIWYNLIQISGILYSIAIGILTLRWINKHIAELKNQYVSVEFRELSWAKKFIFIGLLHTSILVSSLFFDRGFYFSLTMSIINVVLLYWVSLRGILQQNVNSLIPISSVQIKQKKPIPSTEKEKVLLQKLEDYIKTEEAFVKQDLTIIDIAENIDEHPKRISGLINSQLNQNFNSYINSFRIEKAKKLLNSKLANDFSIEGIGQEVGFQSKSTFYDAFKKISGTTPLRYKNQL